MTFLQLRLDCSAIYGEENNRNRKNILICYSVIIYHREKNENRANMTRAHTKND